MIQLSNNHIQTLIANGNRAESWQNIYIDENLDLNKIENCRFGGRVEIEAEVTLADSTIVNYHICRGAKVLSTTRLETRHASKFGNGVKVAAVNENGGREITIYNGLTAQVAYIMAMYRHRKELIKNLFIRIDNATESQFSYMGVVGENSTIIGARFVREVMIGKDVTIEGASLVENATLLDGVYVGIDVKAKDFIAVENSKIDFGATITRCFVGENVVMSNGFTAADSLFFASSHLENGEACSIFAGPYTVSHHKSSLLIAGLFSFFNASSGTNQSNHLFKSGAIHQAIHRRGTKFASNGYVMSPADEGEFTVILGHHIKHHDTSAMPYSYLVEKGGLSYLLPGFGLHSYGSVRDIEKWQKRDKRVIRRDIISYNEYNPLIAGKVAVALDVLKAMLAENPEAELLHYNNTFIKRPLAERGIYLYGLYLTAAIGQMLKAGKSSATNCEKWIDIAGQYIDKGVVDSALENNNITLEELNNTFRSFAEIYDNAAHGWALALLAKRLDKRPTTEDIAAAIAEADVARAELKKITDTDRESDISPKMSIGYGIDSTEKDEILHDFNTVQKR